MPNRKPPSPARPKKSRAKFFWVIAVLALVALVIWFSGKEKGARQKPAAQQTVPRSSDGVRHPSPKILVMTKTNSMARRATNATDMTHAKASENISTSAPPAMPRAEDFPLDPTAPRPAQNILEAQIVLARRGISSGSIDGAMGSQTRAALRAFQQNEQLPITGELDAATKTHLLLTPPLYRERVITTNDFARLQPLGDGWLGKSQQSALDYETILELVAEENFSHPGFIKKINPAINWSNLVAGVSVRVPNVELEKPKTTAAFIRIRLSEKTLEAFDGKTNLLAHFPCSIARRVEKRPVGELSVEKLAPNPDYTFAPENFPESAEARALKTKLILPPGPNNPVGAVWIGLDKPGYGVHGTPKPEEVGRTESHGCFRLANWNAEYLLRLVTVGTPVLIEP